MDKQISEIAKQLPGYEPCNGSRGYIGWAPGDDCLSGEGWSKNNECVTWEKFCEDWDLESLDVDLNFVIDFYFTITYDRDICIACDGDGYNAATHEISENFYSFNDESKAWFDKITQDEVDVLIAHNRLFDFRHKLIDGKRVKIDTITAEEVNAAVRKRRGLVHDAINRSILIETRAKRLGVWGKCPHCGGDGYVRLGDDRIELRLWMAHSRKGATRGITIKSVLPEQLPEVQKWLKKSLEIHERHFEWIMKSCGKQ